MRRRRSGRPFTTTELNGKKWIAAVFSQSLIIGDSRNVSSSFMGVAQICFFVKCLSRSLGPIIIHAMQTAHSGEDAPGVAEVRVGFVSCRPRLHGN
jgi:hypothetical protein